jgi:hypothetical protein
MSGEYGEGIKAGEIFRRAAEALDLNEEEAWIETKDIGWLCVLSEDLDGAEKRLLRASKIFADLSSTGNASAIIGQFFALRYPGVVEQRRASFTTRDYSSAEHFFDNASEILPRIPESDRTGLRAGIQQNIGNVRSTSEKYSLAEDLYRRALTEFAALRDREHVAIASIKLGTAILSRAAALPVETTPFRTRAQRDRLMQDAGQCLWRGWELSTQIGWIEAQAPSKRAPQHTLR